MATQTKTIGSLSDGAGNTATLTFTYDDVALRINSATVVNNMTTPCFVQLTRADGHVYGPFQINAQTTATQNFPGSGANRFGISVDSRGRIDGAEVSFFS